MTMLRAFSSANDTLSALSDTRLNSMVHTTPASGDYLVWFHAEITDGASSESENTEFFVTIDGTRVTHTVRQHGEDTSMNPSTTWPMCIAAHITVDGTDDVEIMYNSSSSDAPPVAHEREFILFPMPVAGTAATATATSTDTATDSTWATVTGMTITNPAADDYLCLFSCWMDGEANDILGIRVTVDGTPVAHSERTIMQESSSSNKGRSMLTACKVSPNGSEDITVEFNEQSGGGSVRIYERTLTLTPFDGIDIKEAFGTSDDADSTTTNKQIDDMLLTSPGASPWLVIFSGHSSIGTITTPLVTDLTVQAGGVEQADTIRRLEMEDSLDLANFDMSLGGRVTVSGSDNLAIFWKGNNTDTRTMHERTLIAVRELSSAFEQEGYRWRNDDGSESAATFRQLQDVVDTVDKNENIRLRTLLDATGDPPTLTRTLQVKRDDEPDSEYRIV